MIPSWQLDDLIQLVRRRYPDWEGCAHPQFAADELEYKRATIAKAQNLLNQEEMDRLLAAGEFDEILARLERVTHDNNLLWRRVPSAGDTAVLTHPSLDKTIFCTQVRNLLYNDRPSPERLQSFSDFLTEQGLPNGWPLPTYLLFVVHPQQEMLVKPQAAQWFLRFVGETAVTVTAPPTANLYNLIRNHAQEMLAALADFDAQDMVDVQSILWVAHREGRSRAGRLDERGQVELDVPPTEPLERVSYSSYPSETIIRDKSMADFSIPTFDQMMNPLLEALAQLGGGAKIKQINRKVAEIMQLSPGQLAIPHNEQGKISEVGYRLAWTRTYLKKYGLIENPQRGFWTLTSKGRNTKQIDEKEVIRFYQQVLAEEDEDLEEIIEEENMQVEAEEIVESHYFSKETFALLTQLHAEPTKAFYDSQKDEFEQFLIRPFKRLMRSVANQLPSIMQSYLETEKRIFSRIPKNDYGQGGAWTHYWGAFYPIGSKRIADVQLSMWINKDFLEFGFYIGEYGEERQLEFQERCRIYYRTLLPLLRNLLADSRIIFGHRDHFTYLPDGSIASHVTLEEWLQNPIKHACDISFALSAAEVVKLSAADLQNLVLQTHQKLFPLVLLALEQKPLEVIDTYLQSTGLFAKLETEETAVILTKDNNPIYELEDCSQYTGFPAEELKRWTQAIHRKGQAVFYGPPGTGKTYLARQLARHLVGGGDGLVELVQFHPAYSYEDFMQGIRPVTVDGQVRYEMQNGRFLDFCRRAAQRSGLSVFIIDELNRANIASVFGELMVLLEYRETAVPLAGGGLFTIPANVRILATMNTADRSIALVDHALRRRFAFIYLAPNFDVLDHFHRQKQTGYNPAPLIKVLTQLNEHINDPHYHVGHSYFLDPHLAQNLPSIWQMEIEPYLEEFFYNQPDRVGSFRWPQIKKRL